METSRAEGILRLLRERGGRVTTATRAVVEMLADRRDHLTAAEIAERVRRDRPDVHSSTIYRILDRLTELGVLTHAHLGQRPAVFHIADDRHDHLVCEHCGAVVDVPASMLQPVARQAAQDFGFELATGHFALGGRCDRCRAP